MITKIILKNRLRTTLLSAIIAPAIASDPFSSAIPQSIQHMDVDPAKFQLPTIWRKIPFSAEGLDNLNQRLISNFGIASATKHFFQAKDGVEAPIYYERLPSGEYIGINFEALFKSLSRPTDIDFSSINVDTFRELFDAVSKEFPDQISQPVCEGSKVTPRMAFNALLGDSEGLEKEVSNWQHHYANNFKILLEQKKGKTALNLLTLIHKLREDFKDPAKKEHARDVLFTFLYEITTHCSAGFEGRIDTVFSKYGDTSFSIENLIQEYKESQFLDFINSQIQNPNAASAIPNIQWFRLTLEGLLGLCYEGEALSSSVDFLEIPQSGMNFAYYGLSTYAKWFSLNIKPSHLASYIKSTINQRIAIGSPNSSHFSAKLGNLLENFSGDSFDLTDDGISISDSAVLYLLRPYLIEIPDTTENVPLYPTAWNLPKAINYEDITSEQVDQLFHRTKRLYPSLVFNRENYTVDDIVYQKITNSNVYKFNIINLYLLNKPDVTQNYSLRVGLDNFYRSLRFFNSISKDATDTSSSNQRDRVLDYDNGVHDLLDHPHAFKDVIDALTVVAYQRNDPQLLETYFPVIIDIYANSYGVEIPSKLLHSGPIKYKNLLDLQKKYPKNTYGKILSYIKNAREIVLFTALNCLTIKTLARDKKNFFLNYLYTSGRTYIFQYQQQFLTHGFRGSLDLLKSLNVVIPYERITHEFATTLLNNIFSSVQTDIYGQIKKLTPQELLTLKTLNTTILIKSTDNHETLWPRFIALCGLIDHARHEERLNQFEAEYGPLIGENEKDTILGYYQKTQILIPSIRKVGIKKSNGDKTYVLKEFKWGIKPWLPNSFGEIPDLTENDRPKTAEEWTEYFDAIATINDPDMKVTLSLVTKHLQDPEFYSNFLTYLEKAPRLRLKFMFKILDYRREEKYSNLLNALSGFFDLKKLENDLGSDFTIDDCNFMHHILIRYNSDKLKNSEIHELRKKWLEYFSKFLNEAVDALSNEPNSDTQLNLFFRSFYKHCLPNEYNRMFREIIENKIFELTKESPDKYLKFINSASTLDMSGIPSHIHVKTKYINIKKSMLSEALACLNLNVDQNFIEQLVNIYYQDENFRNVGKKNKNFLSSIGEFLNTSTPDNINVQILLMYITEKFESPDENAELFLDKEITGWITRHYDSLLETEPGQKVAKRFYPCVIKKLDQKILQANVSSEQVNSKKRKRTDDVNKKSKDCTDDLTENQKPKRSKQN